MGNKNSSMLQDEEIKAISNDTGFSPAQIERLYSRFKSLDKSGICGSLSRQDFLRVPELAINPLCDRIVHMFFVECDEEHDRINFRQFMKVLATFRSSSRPAQSRQVSRQESIQDILSSLSQNKYRHSRHSSWDGVSRAPNGVGLFKKPYSMTSSQHHETPPTLLDPDEPANSRKQKLWFMFKIYDIDNDNRLSLNDLKQILKIMVGNYISESKLSQMAVNKLRQVDRNCDGYIDFDEFCTAFLHRDIDELLRVKFSTSCNDISRKPSTIKTIDANANTAPSPVVIASIRRESSKGALFNIGSIKSNNNNNNNNNNNQDDLKKGNVLANQPPIPITRTLRENIFNKGIVS